MFHLTFSAMHRFLFLFFLLVTTSLPWAEVSLAQSAAGLPARPSPFRFVTDQANLMSTADANTLESGLRRYADNTGTQIVIVTVPSLGGRTVADYGRALGEAWGVGQRDKNNGIVLLLSGQERKVTIQAGSGLQSVITPELTARVINQQMTPSFKDGNYFAGLKKGLNTLMLAANPDSNPDKNKPAASANANDAASAGLANNEAADFSATPPPQTADPASEPFKPQSSVPAPESSGLGIGTLAIAALLIGGVIWFLLRLFRRRNPTASNPVRPTPSGSEGNTPDFLGNRPTGPAGNNRSGGPQQQAPDFYGNRSGGTMGGGGIGGGGMGSILATGAAAAAGAYLGNRMASGGHDEASHGNNVAGFGNSPASLDPGVAGAAGLGGAAGAAGGGFPALGGSGTTDDASPDYFADDLATNDSGPDYFSSDDNSSSSDDNSSYNDLSTDDMGGGGFDSNDDNSGSW